MVALGRWFRTALQAVCPHSLSFGEERRDGRPTRIHYCACRWCGLRRYILGRDWVTAAEFDAWWSEKLSTEQRWKLVHDDLARHPRAT